MSEKTDLLHLLNQLNQVHFFNIAIVIVVAWLLIRGVKRFLPWLADKIPAHLRLHVLPWVPILRLVILTIAIATIIPMIIKPTFQNLITILGALGVAIGFAFKDYVSSLIAGIVTLYEHPYRPGDWVKVDDAYGEVKSLDLRALRLLTPDDTIVTIPHMKIWSNNIYNDNDGARNLLCVAHFYLHPDHDAELVRHKLYDVALTSPYVHLEHRIVVMVSEKPWGTHYQLKAYPVDGRDQFHFISDMTIRGKAALAKLGVEPATALPVAAEP